VIVPAALLLAACSSSSPPTASPTSPAPAAAAPTSAAPTPTAAATTATSALPGHWSGQYSGSFSGTFKLHWRQSGSKLAGTIDLSNPPGTLPINGTVDGSTIKFGTLGSTAITYTGSVSGSSMSGNYQVTTPTGPAGGSWSASKS
jgi:hypothetical protein